MFPAPDWSIPAPENAGNRPFPAPENANQGERSFMEPVIMQTLLEYGTMYNVHGKCVHYNLRLNDTPPIIRDNRLCFKEI